MGHITWPVEERWIEQRTSAAAVGTTKGLLTNNISI
jgi:hypothetical protein